MTEVLNLGRGLVEALHARGPAPGYTDELMLFGRFVGSWNVAWTGADEKGQPTSRRGELHFGWVLGGRAVQDIWIVPGRGVPGKGSRRWRSTGRQLASTTALALHRSHRQVVPLALRDLPRWRGDLDVQRGDAFDAQGGDLRANPPTLPLCGAGSVAR